MRRTALMFVLAGMVGALVATPIAVYASHRFADVQDSNPFHDDISWLADAGVTQGCGPNVFCPKDNVTREQMAAFIRRLAENQVVDAGELEGQGVNDFLGSGQVLTALVTSGGELYGGNAVSADRPIPDSGTYHVTFDRSTEGCIGVASPGAEGAPLGSVFFDATAGVQTGELPTDPAERVTVRTRRNGQIDTAFQLIVFCP